MPLFKSLLPRPLPPRSFELPKSCRECPTISQSGVPTCKTFFHQAVLTPASPQRSFALHLLLIDVSSKWLVSASTGVSQGMCKFARESWNTEFDTTRCCYVRY